MRKDKLSSYQAKKQELFEKEYKIIEIHNLLSDYKFESSRIKRSTETINKDAEIRKIAEQILNEIWNIIKNEI